MEARRNGLHQDELTQAITFLRSPVSPDVKLPIERDGASIVKANAMEVFSAYVPDPKKGPVFMSLLERSFGKDTTTNGHQARQGIGFMRKAVARTLAPIGSLDSFRKAVTQPRSLQLCAE